MNFSRTKYLLLFFILILTELSAQSRIDSLKKLLYEAKGEQYIALQLQLAKVYQEIDSSQISISYAKDALEASEKANYTKGKIDKYL